MHAIRHDSLDIILHSRGIHIPNNNVIATKPVTITKPSEKIFLKIRNLHSYLN
jgi:hypothetical protein